MGTFKKAFYGTLIIGGGLMYLGATADKVDESILTKNLNACQELHGSANIKGINEYTESMDCKFTDAYIEQLESKKVAEAKAKEEAEAKAKADKEAADLAYRNSPEGKTKAFSVQAHGLCQAHVRASAKFPSKVDFDWGSNKKIFNNFSEGKSRIMIQNKGEMMNGLGLMIPFNATCKYDYNPETNTYSVVEILI